MEPQPDWAVIEGDEHTYIARYKLRQLGCHWDRPRHRWLCPPEVAREARKAAIMGGLDESDLDEGPRKVLNDILDALADGKPYPGTKE